MTRRGDTAPCDRILKQMNADVSTCLTDTAFHPGHRAYDRLIVHTLTLVGVRSGSHRSCPQMGAVQGDDRKRTVNPWVSSPIGHKGLDI